MIYKNRIIFSSLILLAVLTTSAYRQNSNDIYPEYVIQEGDFLSIVAARFSTTLDEIVRINQISDPNSIAIGDRIKIPSLKGISGTIFMQSVNLGDTLANISILSGMDVNDILKINKISSLSEVYVGSTLILVQNTNGNRYSAVDTFENGETSLEKAVLQKTNPEKLAKINRLNGSWDIAEKQLLFSTVSEDLNIPVHAISPLIDQIEITNLPLMQGETQVIHLKTPYSLTLSGAILNQDLNFYQEDTASNDWYALFGVDAEQETGLTDLQLSGSNSNGESFDIHQKVVVEPGVFTYEVVSGVDASTLEDHSNEVDQATLAGITQTSPIKSWGDRMSYPVDEPCLVSGFGNRRTYNDGSYTNFHSGVDFGVCTANNINIYAAADGTVLFSGDLPIHGKHTIIDHGWGVYSTYSHQSETFVTAGQQVKRGDLIGLIGSTGRSVGPHLHWEIKVNGIYVNPLAWINNSFP